MEVKILCGCGTKFSFDVEPVNGAMPVAIQCPQCAADVTSQANEIITQKLSTQPAPLAVPLAVPAVKTRLAVAGSAHAVPLARPMARPAAAVEDAGETSQEVMCPKHLRNVATSNCYVCRKPICPECMGLFGYLCSVQCKYQAEQQGIQVPAYQFKKATVENEYWKKVARISAAIVLTIIFLISAGLWYEYTGSHPKPMYSLKFAFEKAPAHAEFLGPDEILLVFPEKLVVHDLKKKKELWTAPLTEEKTKSETEDEDRYYYRSAPRVHLAKDVIWVAAAKQVRSFDRKTGVKKQTIDLPGEITRMRADDSGLYFFTKSATEKTAITTLDPVSGEAKTQETVPTPSEYSLVPVEMPEGVPPTAAFLLNRALASEDDRKKAMKTVYSHFISAGANTIEMQVRMVAPNIVSKQTMKEKGPTAINSNLSASSPAGVVAEEIFNDLRRSSTGGVKEVDESRYGVTLRRLLNNEIAPFTVEVVGPPAIIPLQTIDVLVAGQSLHVVDKQNKKLFEAKLTYPVPEEMSMLSGQTPYVETGNTLYAFDQGVLTAFDLPGGNVRWRMTSVGISKIQADADGDLYVNSTTASPEDIQYSEQIKINDPAKPILLKVEAKTGKVLWKSSNVGDCEISGKYIYALSTQSGGVGLAQGLSQALGSSMDSSGHFRIFRINEGNGRQIWDYYNSGPPEQVDFEGKRILLRFGNEVRVLKFLAF